MRLSASTFLAWSVFATHVAAYSNITDSTCEILSSRVTNSVFFPDSDTYNASITSYPFTQLRLHPACVLRPKNAEEVSAAVNTLSHSATKFAVRGGGHNANTGFNNIENGLTIDMRSMSAVSITADHKVVRVGAGAIWQDVYDVTDGYNISVLGGRIGVVGVAGFTTGGGISFFSPERGWACDYVLNFQVVLANGDLVNANATSRSDLFAALKGGQNNFGIVTRFDLKAFPAGAMWGGRIAFAPETDTALVQGFTDFRLGQYDPYAAGWVTFRYNGTAKQLTPTTVLWYTRPELKPGALAHMTDVQPQTMNGMQTAYPAEFARNASQVVKSASRRTIWATTTFQISPTIVHSIYNLWKRTVLKLCDSYPGLTSELTFQALAPRPGQNSTGPNSFGFSPTSHPEKDLVFLQIIFYFTDAGQTEGLNNALKEYISMFDEIAEKEGKRHKYLYLNFAAWFQDPLGGYGAEQVKRLKTISKKYDPKGFFQSQLVGGFKVGGRTRYEQGRS